jgi:hypothetical protein
LAIQGICNADSQHSSPERCHNQLTHYPVPTVRHLFRLTAETFDQ